MILFAMQDPLHVLSKQQKIAIVKKAKREKRLFMKATYKKKNS